MLAESSLREKRKTNTVVWALGPIHVFNILTFNVFIQTASVHTYAKEKRENKKFILVEQGSDLQKQ